MPEGMAIPKGLVLQILSSCGSLPTLVSVEVPNPHAWATEWPAVAYRVAI